MAGVLIADGHAEVRAALRLVVEQRLDWQVRAEAASGHEALALVSRGCVDLILLDMQLNGLPGANDERARRPLAELVASFNRLCPGVRVVAMSSLPEDRSEAIAARADGFLCKSDPPDRLREMLAEFASNSGKM